MHFSFGTPLALALALGGVSVLSSCSLLNLDDLAPAACRSDGDCQVFSPSDDCSRFACVIETGQCEAVALDADGDGEAPVRCGGSDCDDADPLRFSAATELCNGVDDNCDGRLNGPDEDDDLDDSADLCAGVGAVADCDDGDPFTFVGAPELCDRIDNDCLSSGVARFSGGRAIEESEDVDNDGHASPGASCMAGPADDPRFLPIDDCDDENPLVYAGATELCDGLDNDCDGVPDEAEGSDVPGSTCVPVQIAAGAGNTCVETRLGGVVCWGRNTLGQLGTAPRVDDDSAVLHPTAREPEQMAISSDYACMLKDGVVTCWGSETALERRFFFSVQGGAIGRVDLPAPATDVDASSGHTCAVLDDGRVFCWGSVFFGSVDGTTSNTEQSLLPFPMPGVEDAVQVSAGSVATCALLSSGEISCGGTNPNGRLGIGSTMNGVGRVTGIDDATKVVAGGGHMCALRSSGRLSCWGDNTDGQVGCEGNSGCPTGGTASTPQDVAVDGEIADLVAGSSHACVLLTDGTVRCWGDNRVGQLGNSEEEDRGAPVQVSGVEGAIAIAAGERHTCALTTSGVECWGSGLGRELGDGRTDHPIFDPFWGAIPQPASVLASPVQIEAGFDDTCFRLPTQEVRCVGIDTWGEIGVQAFTGVATRFQGFERGLDVCLGRDNACGILLDGTVECFGQGNTRITGTLEGIDSAFDLDCGARHACVVQRDGTVWCLGYNDRGQVGTAESLDEQCMGFVPCTGTPRPVEGLAGAEAVASGDDHSCALLTSDEVWCWGDNLEGQLGFGPLGRSQQARPVEGLPSDPVIAIDAGGDTSCALTRGRSVWCWGDALPGSGAGGTPDPTRVSGLDNVVEISMGPRHLCGRLSSGAVRCVGDGSSGQLGDGSLEIRSSPVAVENLSDAVALGCGERHCCATRSSGQAVCWGEGEGGRLGNGSTTGSPRPVTTVSMTRF